LEGKYERHSTWLISCVLKQKVSFRALISEKDVPLKEKNHGN